MDEKWYEDFYKGLVEKRTDYRGMIDFCCESLVLNNEIVPALAQKDIFFDTYCCGERDEEAEEDEEVYDEIFQYFIIAESDADRLSRYTNELVIYNEDIDLYLLCVTHYGTAWQCVEANWKSLKDFLRKAE